MIKNKVNKMKKLLFAIPIFLILTTSVWATSILVTDITKGDKITFTPGNNYFWGSHPCSYNWGGDKAYKLTQFMEGASSYSYDTMVVGSRTRCINIQTDVVNLKVNIPYVNQESLMASLTPPKSGQAGVTFASSPNIATPFILTDNIAERNTMNLEAGVFGTSSYFRCEVASPSLMLDWLRTIGVESGIPPGWVLDISWITSHQHCFVKSFTFNPKLLSPPAVIVNPTPKPPVNCIQ